LAVRDVKLRYRQTALGAIWVIIQPLMSAGLLAFIFNTVAKLPSEDVPYFVLTLAGQLGWNVFSGTLGKASGSIVAHSGMISKVYFPRMLLPLSSILGSLLDFGVGMLALIGLLIYYGIAPGIAVLLLPFWISLLLMLGVGLGLTASALMVTYRDVGHILPVLTTLLMYASAVPYSLKVALDRVGPQFHIFFFINPLSGIIEGLRWSLLGTTAPQAQYVLYSAVCAVAVLFGGLMLFKRLESNFADVI
jgi:lipopolysaccharide transport system permease protein